MTTTRNYNDNIVINLKLQLIHYGYAILKCFDITYGFDNINDSKDQYHINPLRSKFNANCSLRSMLGEKCNFCHTFEIIFQK